MSARAEILKKLFLEKAYVAIDDFDFDDGVSDANSELIEKIRKAVVGNSETTDFETVEKIIELLESYGIDCTGAHDFG